MPSPPELLISNQESENQESAIKNQQSTIAFAGVAYNSEQ
jgi:hypothetical protein